MKYLILLLFVSCGTKTKVFDLTNEVETLESQLNETRDKLNEYQTAYLQLLKKHPDCAYQFGKIIEKNNIK